jgi:hypothetical protein
MGDKEKLVAVGTGKYKKQERRVQTYKKWNHGKDYERV